MGETQHENKQALAAYQRQFNDLVVGRLAFISEVCANINTPASRFVSNIIATLTALSGISNTLTHLKRPLDSHMILEDSHGLILHLDFVNSWEAFDSVLENRFKGKNRSRRVLKGQYLVQEQSSGRQVDRTSSFEASFRPKDAVVMSVVSKTRDLKANRQQNSSCPWCHTPSSTQNDEETDW